ncbi:hypothetical protein ACIBCU_24850 [Streptomyces sp. NPDC051064]|uniref:hypothetical protein n=1 Tax=Streptomyces sp. NPDC051064 TaxID=3365641 RepID=UPI0037A9F4F3
MVAESVRNDRGRQFKELLADGGAAGGGGRDPDFAEERGQVVGAGRLPCPATRKEPAGGRVGGGVHVVAVRDVLQQQGVDRCGDG